MRLRMAPPLEVGEWLNTETPITLESLRGKVVLIEAFQMLCPGCVSHSLPQALRARQLFSEDDVAVIGLHCVFEHHAAQGSREALAAFLHEYRIGFPVGIDTPSANLGPPRTMTAYNMQGTPTIILIDRHGRLRKQKFGTEQDMLLGAEVMSLLREGALADRDAGGAAAVEGCDEAGCALPER